MKSQFFGDLEGFLDYAENNSQFSPTFCPKHWAPCPVEGKNGLMASIEVMKWLTMEMPAEIRERGPEAMNKWVASQTVSACCRMGDEKMAEIWERC